MATNVESNTDKNSSETFKLLSKPTLNFLEKNNFSTLTEVQRKTIPSFLNFHDVVVKAFTGSGKTLAFLIPIFEIVLRRQRSKIKSSDVLALIVSPTRELAIQIHKVCESINAHFSNDFLDLSLSLHVGGKAASFDAAPKADRFVSFGNIVVGTPGRLCKLLTEQTPDFKKFEVLIFDEADRLLEAGYEKDVAGILQKVPRQRRTGLFSATRCVDVKRMSLRNPLEIVVNDTKSQNCPDNLRNFYSVVNAEDKFSLLLTFLTTSAPNCPKIIVFFLTCASVDYFGVLSQRILASAENISIFAIHGKMSKNKRKSAVASFCAAKSSASVLFTTDLMARGIDFDGINHIVQFDVPQNPDFFVHRIGRTARMGKQGESLLLLIPTETDYLSILSEINVPISLKSDIAAICPAFSSQSLFPKIREWAVADRDILEKGVKAYTAFVRGYNEHYCKAALPIERLPFGGIAVCFGLVYAPKIWDIRSYPKKKKDDAVAGFEESAADVSKIVFLDKNKQKMRLESVLRRGERKAERLRKVAEKAKMAKRLKREGVQRRRKIKQSENQKLLFEWDDLARETGLYRKFRRGKITKREYEIAVGERKAE